jgi:predicted small lipoprotein YifL
MRLLSLVLLFCALSACGLKGDLVIPEAESAAETEQSQG